MYIPRKMRNTSILLIFSVCLSLTLVAVTFQQTEALRRIKRGSATTQNKTRLTSDLLSDIRNTSNDAHFGGHTLTALDRHEGVKGRSEHTWAKKAVAAVEHAIDQAFASLSHKSDAGKEKKVALHSTNNPKPKDGSIAAGDLPMSALSHMLTKRGLSARILDDMQRNAEFTGSEGPAEVLVIDNGFQPMLGMQHGINSFSLHQPNLHSVASNFKRMADLDKEYKLNNPHSPKLTTYTSHMNADNGPMAVKHSGDNRIIELNGNKEGAVVKNNKRNDNNGDDSRDDYKMVASHKRNNDHVTLTSEEHNGEAKHNNNDNSNNHISSNNDEFIGDKSHSTVSALQQHNQQFQQQKLQEQSSEHKDSFPALLSHSQKSIEGIEGESSKLHEELQEQQQRKKHDSGKSVEVGGTRALQQANLMAKPHQQQVQVVKHSSGKMLPMESFLKFANMMLYKMGADGVPMHAQGAQLAVSGNPTTSVISIGPVMEGAEDLGTMDYLYNPFEPKMNFLRNSGSFAAAPSLIGGSTNTALVSRPFLLPPYSLASSAQPINFIENALDLLLNAEEEGNDEMELVCPIHHPKKKSSDGDANTNEKDGVIQVCSCRFFKKNKNA